MFRIKIPVHLLPLFAGRKVITKSLQTYHRPTALKAARRYAAKADELFYQLDMKSKYLFDKTILKGRHTLERAKLSELKEKLSPEAHRLLMQEEAGTSPELDELIAKTSPIDENIQRIEAKIEKLNKKIRIAEVLELRNEVLADYGLTSTAPEENSPALSELWEQFRAAKIRSKKWKTTDKSKMKERENQFGDFLEIIGGDRPASNFKRADADKFIDDLLIYPKSRRVTWNHISDWKDIPVTKPEDKISQSTAAQRIEFISGFFKYLVQEDKIASNPFSGKLIERDSKSHPTPTQQDLEEWFNLPEHLIGKAWQFWIPRIALFSGARQNEIAQLRAKDVKQDEDSGIWLFSVNSNDGKSRKTPAAERNIPLHTELLANGFIDYVQLIRTKGQESLWPDLVGKDDDLGAEVSAYWTKLRDTYKVLSEPKAENGKTKTFHSLRRIIINKLSKAKVEFTTIQSIVGHELSIGSTIPYHDEVDIELKNEAMHKLVIDGVSWAHNKKFAITK